MQITIKNTALKRAIKILKKNGKTDTPLSGAVFELFKLMLVEKLTESQVRGEEPIAESVEEYVSIRQNLKVKDAPTTEGEPDETGELLIDDLTVGKYKLVETTTPEDFYNDEAEGIFFEITVETITEEGKDPVENLICLYKEEKLTEPATIEVTNMPYIELRIIKEDFDTGEVLEGAHFDLVRLVTKRSLVEGEDPSIIEEIVKEDECTDEKGCITISGLKPGEYKLVEKKAPNGYVLPKNKQRFIALDHNLNDDGEEKEVPDDEDVI